MIRQQNKIVSSSIVPGVRLDLNPFSQRAGTARKLTNFIPEKQRLMRKPYASPFQVKGSAYAVWSIVDFRYHRASAPESMLLVFRADGKIYRRTAGSELEIFPGNTGYSVLNHQPKPVVLANRLFFADSSSAYLYDGRTFRSWGIAAPASAPVVSVDTGGTGLTAASGLSASFTWVVLDESGVRVHESTHSPASAFSAALTDDEFRIDITGISPPAGVTHWSGYMSELDGSGVRRRVNTSRITTLTYDVSAFPAGSARREPYRNDPPAASPVMAQWKNRIAMRDETDKSKIWFTAFGEVIGLGNGSGEESVPGKSSSSLSDIINSFRFPDPEVRLLGEHANYLIIHTMQAGHAIVGTAGTVDSTGTRGLTSAKVLTEGGVGPYAGCSTPYGWAWMTPGRKVNLWVGNQVLNVGDAIQAQLNTIPASSLESVQFFWWDGNGRKWLLVALDCADTDDLTGTTQNRILGYDFAQMSDSDHPGEWSLDWVDHEYTFVSDYFDGSHRFLLGGEESGEVYQLDTILDPCHLNRSAVLGECYLGSSIQDNPASTVRTGLILPNERGQATGLYLSITKGTQDGPSTNLGEHPTVRCAVNPIDPDSEPPIALSVDDPKDAGEYLSWLAADVGSDKSGALGKQFQFEASFDAGHPSNEEADGRLTSAIDSIYKLEFSWSQQAESSE